MEAKTETDIKLEENDVALILKEDGGLDLYIPGADNDAQDALASCNAMLITAIAIKLVADSEFGTGLVDFACEELEKIGEVVEVTEEKEKE